ncbi:MAG: methylenetetrahydromethanopterin dehydrogenase [Pirellulaceae bacterium]|jgi:hypothetical protein|nr:methylenetetrahydromethanopterin dehydrogenase [Pirellulaceae bacterium]HJN12210.1 NAD(P)-dependent methylenetetrahydromethanopterin dehydrogenase [Pirellulaceae bacterium]
MSKPKILVQIDSDDHASLFDAVVGVDCQIDHLLQYSSVQLSQVRDLVHGAIFTRGPDDLRNTAIFVGGSDVSAGEALLEAVTSCFFGPMRVSVMLDASGANTTAAAAVLAAARHTDLCGAEALVLAATGPVGQRATRLLARSGAHVRVASRSEKKAEAVCRRVHEQVENANLTACSVETPEQAATALRGVRVLIAAGAVGIQLLSEELLQGAADLRIAIDLNAVPPLGIAGSKVSDVAVERNGVLYYGAIGVGGTKMRIHKAAVRQLFASNGQVLDAEEIFSVGAELENA